MGSEILCYSAWTFPAIPIFPDDHFPGRSIRILVGSPVGSYADRVARAFEEGLANRLGQPVRIENVDDAAGQATSVVRRAPADGYTLLLAAGSRGIGATSWSRLGFPRVEDFTFIRALTKVQNVLLVPADSPIRSVSEYVKAARQTPAGISLSLPKFLPGTSVAAAQFSNAAAVKLRSEMCVDSKESISVMTAGRTQSSWAEIDTALPYIERKAIRALGVVGDQRSEFVPDVPTFDELGFRGISGSSWTGLLGPARLPSSIVEKIDHALASLIATPEIIDRLTRFAAVPVAAGQSAYRNHLVKEINSYASIAKGTGMRVV